MTGTDRDAATAGQVPDGPEPDDRIAVIGMAGRFPGADDVDALWRLSVEGGSGLSRVGEAGAVGGVRGVLPDVDRFDAAFFGIPEHEAAIIDPQQRILLEVVQHAADDAGQDLGRAGGPVAVYAATAVHPRANPADTPSARYQWELANGVDFVATRISYRLGLHGESMTVQTGCSSSLVAVHLAVQSLLSGQSELAIAAGVSVPPDQSEGYLVEDGMIASPSGRCRPFDIAADGTVPGAGAGAVLLMRLSDALRDGHRVRAVVLGTAVNNDGASKVGFMAPSPTGQAEAIATAHAVANVLPGSIGYVETHGTATQLGDEVEIEGLRRAFELDADRQLTCWLGSLKANCGHLDRAAGVAGFIRAVLALEAGVIPPMAGCSQPNPKLDLAGAHFGLPLTALDWPASGGPRRAGVSAFGVGGTNAHVVLEQAPVLDAAPAAEDDQPRLWLLSAHQPESLRRWACQLADRLAAEPAPAAAVAGALAGRRPDRHRSWLVATTGGGSAGSAEALRELPAVHAAERRPTVVFAFPGQGDPVVDGLAELYAGFPVFARAIDRCAERVRELAGYDLRADLYQPMAPDEREALFADMSRFQPALFAVQWALAELWRSWGVHPDVVIGHSIGEVAAAACASVLDLEDALTLTVERSRLLEQAPLGATISVALPPDQLGELPPGVEVASVNGRELVTLTGPAAAIDEVVAELAGRQVFTRRLNIRHSPHSSATAAVSERLNGLLRDVAMRPPEVPILSNVTGDWIREEMADPGYWARQLRSPVRFDSELGLIGELAAPVVLALGPGAGFGKLLEHELAGRAAVVTAHRGPAGDRLADWLDAAGHAWSRGVLLDPAVLCPPVAPRPALPPTAFDHSRRWPAAIDATDAERPARSQPARVDDPGGWLYQPVWRPAPGGGRRRAVHWLSGASSGDWPAALAETGELTVHAALPPDWRPAEPVDLLWRPEPGALLPQAAELAGRLAGLDVRIWLLAEHSVEQGAGLEGGAESGAALAACRVIPQEFPGARWNLLTLPATPTAERVGELRRLLETDGDGLVATLADAGPMLLRQHRLWPDWRSRPLRPGGCYLILGGAGRVGLALARELDRQVGARLVLTGRRPAEAVAGDLAGLPATVRYVQLDVTDRAAVRDLLDELRAEHGRVDGVIHAAGMTDRQQFTLAADTTDEQLRHCAAAKVEGTLALAEALGPDEADFVLLCSSLSVLLGGIRFGGYLAANAWLDEFARQRFEAGDRRWLSVQWDGWTPTPGTVRPDSPADPLYFALDDADGGAVLLRVLASPAPVIAVSTAELADRLASVHRQLDGGQPDEPAATGQAQAAGPVDAAALVRSVLREVLGSVPADPDRNLHAEGVESLTILQIVSRLRAAADVAIPLAAVIRDFSVNAITRLLQQLLEQPAGGEPASGAFRVERAAPRESYPTSPTQRRWLELLGEHFGGIDLLVDVRGPVPAERLRDAVRTVLERHTGLRTLFERTDGWWQRVMPAPAVPLVDLRELSEADREERVTRFVTEQSRRWFEVTREVPFEVTVFALEADRHALFVHAHHVLFDGWSSSIVLRDIARAATGELDDAPPLQYTDYAVAQQEQLSGPALLEQRAHWTALFDGAPEPTRLPVTGGEPAGGEHGEVLPFTVPRERVAELRRRAAERAMTPFTLFMTAYAALVGRYSGERDLIVGTTMAGRPSPDTEEIVGVFVNPLPVRFRIDPDEPVAAFAEQVHRVLIDFHERNNYPMEDLVGAVPPFVGRGLNDTFYCYLLYQNYWRPDGHGLDYAAVPVPGVHHTLMRDWEIVLTDTPAGLTGELWYRPRRFSAGWADGALADFQRLLAELADPASWQRPVGELLDRLSPR